MKLGLTVCLLVIAGVRGVRVTVCVLLREAHGADVIADSCHLSAPLVSFFIMAALCIMDT